MITVLKANECGAARDCQIRYNLSGNPNHQTVVLDLGDKTLVRVGGSRRCGAFPRTRRRTRITLLVWDRVEPAASYQQDQGNRYAGFNAARKTLSIRSTARALRQSHCAVLFPFDIPGGVGLHAYWLRIVRSAKANPNDQAVLKARFEVLAEALVSIR